MVTPGVAVQHLQHTRAGVYGCTRCGTVSCLLHTLTHDRDDDGGRGTSPSVCLPTVNGTLAQGCMIDQRLLYTHTHCTSPPAVNGTHAQGCMIDQRLLHTHTLYIAACLPTVSGTHAQGCAVARGMAWSTNAYCTHTPYVAACLPVANGTHAQVCMVWSTTAYFTHTHAYDVHDVRRRLSACSQRCMTAHGMAMQRLLHTALPRRRRRTQTRCVTIYLPTYSQWYTCASVIRSTSAYFTHTHICCARCTSPSVYLQSIVPMRKCVWLHVV
jgi:hypothetical protein